MPEQNKVVISHDVIVIGGGQAGLSVGYYLSQRGISFVILDTNKRIGDAWRNRWDSLRLFTPARFSALVGMPFPAPGHYYPTKDEMADYLESYAKHFQLPVRTGIRVDRLSRKGGRFILEADGTQFEAENVIVAMSNEQKPRVPAFASALDPRIVQMHSIDYRSPSQLQEGPVLIVGAGNSGADIGLEVAHGHRTWLSGRDTGHVPIRIEGLAARVVVPILFRVVFHRVLTLSTPVGRKVRSKILSGGMPLVRVKPQDIAAAGIERVPRAIGVRDGLPLLEGDRVLDVANVIWCTGFEAGLSWIDLPVFQGGEPMQRRGVVASEPGLYFVGLDFLYAASSSMIQGVSRDAAYIARQIASSVRAEKPQPETRTADAAA